MTKLSSLDSYRLPLYTLNPLPEPPPGIKPLAEIDRYVEINILAKMPTGEVFRRYFH